ncbi:MAG: polysaccharide biosynthesis protein [Ruminococcaceae bacterium]|nr:polysaccharide biosynthesis protein [Oscillospiraceae bacterium]
MKERYLGKARKLITLLFADAVFFALSFFLANLLTAGSLLDGKGDLYWLLFTGMATLLTFFISGLYSVEMRSVGFYEMLRIMTAIGVLTLLDTAFSLITGFARFSSVFVFFLIFADLVVFSRFFLRWCRSIKYRVSARSDHTRVMVVGGGSAGSVVIQEMKTSKHIRMFPVCVIDDDPAKLHSRICGVPIVGNRHDIERMAVYYDIKQIFITIPSAKGEAIRDICEICSRTSCRVQILPGVYQMLDSTTLINNLREIDVNDLLGRAPAEINTKEVFAYLQGKHILVTGGGGSIGSELCRQIAAHNPAKLVIFDIYENNAYDIEMELRRSYPYLDLEVLIGSVRDMQRLRTVFDKIRPEIVFHAAAHKHVPLMERSPKEAIKNNVFGTYNVAKVADEYRAERFVMISTDKAVNPTNIMGATKRICEMIVQTFGRRSEHTDYVAVRFGNVLGSNGSVIPLFKKQIEAGGPVTVTHRDIVRYFMTIPEAVSLVLQAGAYATGGEIFVLDMGEPVKIVTLAENLIRLSGYKPYEEIPIVFTGLRPGEKLYEELLMAEEGMKSTANQSIYIGKPIQFDEDDLWKTLDEMREMIANDTDEYKALIKRLVPTYHEGGPKVPSQKN